MTLALPWSVPIGATAPHELTARIDPQNKIAETDETNNDAVLAVLKPDLVVTDVTSVTTSTGIVVTAIVANQGGSPTLASLKIVLRLDDPAATADVATHTISSPLAPGAAVTVVFTIPDPGPSLLGSRPGWIIADATQAVDESDEGNNAALAGLHPFLSWQNPLDRLDVSNDTSVDALDVLLNINRINAAGVGLLPVPPTPPLFYDVDGAVTPQDVLLVINFLNNRVLPPTGGEGEAADAAEPQLPLPLASVLPSGHSAVLDFFAAWPRPASYPTEPRPGATDVNQQPVPAKFAAIVAARRGDAASQSPSSAAASRLPSIWDDLDGLAGFLDELARDWWF